MKNLFLLFFIVLFGCSSPLIEEPLQLKSAFSGGEIIVKFKEGAKVNLQDVGKIKEHIKKIDVLSVANVEEALKRLKSMPEVEYAEANRMVKYYEIPDDTYYLNGELWGTFSATSTPKSNVNGTNAVIAWNNGHVGDRSVVVGVVDGGCFITHEDLAANIFKNPGEIANNGKDDDGNGFIDDVSGWDFMNNDKTVYDKNEDAHATHVSGTIGAIGGNGKGVAGICWKISIIPCKFMNNRGGLVTDGMKGIYYLLDLKKTRGINIVAINVSWGWLGDFYQSMYDVIMECNDNGIMIVCAAGNNGMNMDTFASTFQAYPAAYDCPNIISVAAMGFYGEKCAWSNYGATMVDIAAPGEWIKSTIPVGGKVKIGYDWMKGTSMAAPHVTGAVALYKSTHPSATIAEIKQTILTSATPTSAFNGNCVTGGRLNVANF